MNFARAVACLFWFDNPDEISSVWPFIPTFGRIIDLDRFYPDFSALPVLNRRINVFYGEQAVLWLVLYVGLAICHCPAVFPHRRGNLENCLCLACLNNNRRRRGKNRACAYKKG